MNRTRLVGLAVTAALLASGGAATAAAGPGAATGYRVGTAVVDITPTTPQWLGGFGQMGAPTAKAHDPLQVRAFVVEQGSKALAFAIVDTQGWFAGYQEGAYGVSDARDRAATWLAGHGFPGTDSTHVIVSSTHSHAAPTVMGIWGATDVSYLRRIHDATVQAISRAASTARPARLFYADAEVGTVDGQNVSQTDIYDGWWVDGDLPLLVAKDPHDGDVVGIYANVPIHADVVCGACEKQMSADHIGFARADLDRRYDTTTVLAMGTLGRQESIVQVGGYEASYDVADHVTQQIRWALTHLKPVTGNAFGASEQYVQVPGTNPALLALIVAHHAGADTCATSICSIDRADTPPYMTGTAIGTWMTAIRIGNLLYVTEPGEAFPEVSKAIRDSIPGAVVRIVGMAQDQLGYYWPAEDGPFTMGVNDSDHLEYNSSVALADLNVQAAVANARALGLDAVVGSHPAPGVDDPAARRNPGVQFFAVDQPGRQVLLVAAYNPAFDGTALTGGSRPVRWEFGDGSRGTSGERATHTFARPGTYRVTATVTDESGRSRSWSQQVRVG